MSRIGPLQGLVGAKYHLSLHDTPEPFQNGPIPSPQVLLQRSMYSASGPALDMVSEQYLCASRKRLGCIRRRPSRSEEALVFKNLTRSLLRGTYLIIIPVDRSQERVRNLGTLPSPTERTQPRPRCYGDDDSGLDVDMGKQLEHCRDCRSVCTQH